MNVIRNSQSLTDIPNFWPLACLMKVNPEKYFTLSKSLPLKMIKKIGKGCAVTGQKINVSK